MQSFSSIRRIYVARDPQDMRRGIDSLSCVVENRNTAAGWALAWDQPGLILMQAACHTCITATFSRHTGQHVHAACRYHPLESP